MDAFRLRDQVVSDYAEYVRSFVQIKEPRVRQFVEDRFAEEALWPQPLIQMNPSFEPGGWVDDLVREGVLHAECGRIFRIKSDEDTLGKPMRLHRHQTEAIHAARAGVNYALTTGTGSGKSLSYIVPIVDRVLRGGRGRGVQAIVVYPMNALCNSQYGELEKFLRVGYGVGREPVRFERYTGQESHERREEILRNPPDILLTNYVMLELLLTRPFERPLIDAARGLSFLVLDELHTYRGRQGADVALLVRRVREACDAREMLCVGTSATMASGGTYDEQRRTVASVATRLFGAEVRPEHVIGETLTRATGERDFQEPRTLDALRQDLDESAAIPTRYEKFVGSAMAAWLEDTFGLRRDAESGRLVRARPRPVTGEYGAARQLSEITGIGEAACEGAIRRWLLAGYICEPHPESGTRPFAFRLHQFVSRGDTVYTSPEDHPQRHLSLSGQQFVPGHREKILLPLAFCRECGAEYHTVWRTSGPGTGHVLFRPRDLFDRVDSEEDGEAGFLYRDPENPWPEDLDVAIASGRVPDDWLDGSERPRVRSDRKGDLPQPVPLGPDGAVREGGLTYWYTPTPFRFCQNCGVSYRARRRESDFGRLATLASGGRSTATTVLSISTVRCLRAEDSLKDLAKKLLSFTDNRQDASLQAGHFNDFVEVSLLRAALYQAAAKAGREGIAHDELAQRVFQALGLDLELYAREPGVQFAQKLETERAFRNVLAYRVYRDQKRGWRVTSPNLEQCGLLVIDYPSLDELCRAEDYWQDSHAALVQSSPATREAICRTLLDYMRRELAIDVEYLTPEFFERLQQQSSQRLRSPWAVDEQERGEQAGAVFPRPRRPYDSRYHSFLSGRSGFGLYLSRRGTLPEFEQSGEKLKTNDKEQVLQDLCRVLGSAGFLTAAAAPTGDDDIPGYQLSAAAMRWLPGDGTAAFHDVIRVPNPPEGGSKSNEFFVDYYRTVAGELQGMEAREHTAQVPYEERQERERRFGEGHLPVLYCSPTMELGVDIRQLNAVNMRNVPPTPANYAQRSGRAGRSGQPAFVLTYCATGNSHDQYFFRQPERMVAGAVDPPQLDLANEDLVRAHVHAVWLAETGQALGNSLTELLDCEGEKPTLEVLPGVRDGLSRPGALERAQRKSQTILASLGEELEKASWYKGEWLTQTLGQSLRAFEAACGRWRSLFRAAKAQYDHQSRVIGDISQRPNWEDAKRLRREAESQLSLLTDARNVIQSDFYSYRYFASEGFLPGYNFPRLPLAAFIPARRRLAGRDEFLSRPRFLAVSEFGPRSIIYHEGSRYIVSKVILPVGQEEEPITTSAKQCLACGYVRELRPGEPGPDRCENCDGTSLHQIGSLLRMQNVATKRRDRINSDEEERTRMGYEIRTGLRFAEVGGLPRYQVAEAAGPAGTLLRLTYGDAATLWRVNLGWRRRAQKEQLGFVLDMERGTWARNDQLPDEEDPGDAMGHRTQRVVPFVEDRRNCLIVEPAEQQDARVMASLEAALKKAVQAVYQLEDNELAAEPLPTPEDRRRILLYESAEGGAGVLRRLLDAPQAVSQVAREALRICHFDPDTGEDRRRAPGAAEDCEAACYDCLMSYANQRVHDILDRKQVKDLLLELAGATVQSSPSPVSFSEHLAELKRRCDSQLERNWLDFIAGGGYRLPSAAQQRLDRWCGTKPDFVYEREHTAVYIDGPPHDYPERQQRDAEVTGRLEDNGIVVLRFHHQADWARIVAAHPNIFGTPQAIPPSVGSSTPTGDTKSTEEELDLDLFPDDWHPVIGQLTAREGVVIEPGGDVAASGRVQGAYVLDVIAGQSQVWVVDGRAPSADKLVVAVTEGGKIGLAVDPTSPSASGEILSALGEAE